MDSSFEASPLVAGVIVSSASVFSALVSTQLGRLTSVLRAETLVKTSFVLYAAALCLVPVIPAVWLLLVPTAIFGIAEGINIPNILGLLTGSAPGENRGAVMSVNGMILRLGQTLGPLLIGLAAALSIGGAYFVAAALAGAMFFVAFALIR
jgi:MFS transporter, ACDE family, multidrug resistance protein